MTKRSMVGITGLCTAAALCFSAAALAQPEPQPNGPENGASDLKVVVAGENPAIRKLDKKGGQAVSSVNYFKVNWSPVGTGAVCFVTVQHQDDPDDNFKIAISDNPAVREYVENELLGKLGADFSDYKPINGTISQEDILMKERHIRCESAPYDVEMIFKDLGPGQWADIKMGPVAMSFVMVPANGGEIIINGKSAPGTWYPTGGGFGTGAYLTLNETWRR